LLAKRPASIRPHTEARIASDIRDTDTGALQLAETHKHEVRLVKPLIAIADPDGIFVETHKHEVRLVKPYRKGRPVVNSNSDSTAYQ